MDKENSSPYSPRTIGRGYFQYGLTLSIIFIFYTLLIAGIMSVFLSVNMCLNIIWFGGLCLSIAWLIFVWIIGLTGTSLFILGSITGLVIAPLFSLSFGLFNQRLNVIPMLIALLLCG